MTTTPAKARIAADPDDTWSAQPVDSATRPCCGGIGAHTRDCPEFDWRGQFADHLTADEIGHIEALERDGNSIFWTWYVARRMSWEHLYADVPPPPEATEVDDDWEPIHSVDLPSRYFRGSSWGEGITAVSLGGHQDADGSVNARWISTAIQGETRVDPTTGDWREIAANLLAAADELDALESN